MRRGRCERGTVGLLVDIEMLAAAVIRLVVRWMEWGGLKQSSPSSSNPRTRLRRITQYRIGRKEKPR